MAQLRSSLSTPEPVEEVAAENRWRWARWLFAAHDPGTRAEAAYRSIRDEYVRLAALDLSTAERLTALDDFLEANGWLDSAHRQLR